MKQSDLVNVSNFIVATRDSGYKSTASALAEIIDNSIEAHATKITIAIKKDRTLSEEDYELVITDNGCGMGPDELILALQFGGSTRFDSRSNLGRYGMGLPNSSLSQCKRVEVISWKDSKNVFTNYLDVDEVVANHDNHLNPIKKVSDHFTPRSISGTIITWRKCDRLSYKYLKSLIKHIHFELGRIFRHAIWRGVSIKIDEELVVPFDPLFQGKGINKTGSIDYGNELVYKVKVPGSVGKLSAVKVRFVELPVLSWANLSNDEKRKNQITKCAGVSVLRSEREIDYGWFFMGDKRKENYDDWWRCEISFLPELDEVFGVTHTKQEIKETEFMSTILVSDIEQIARALNNRVRVNFISFKEAQPVAYSKTQLERTDVYQPALIGSKIHQKSEGIESSSLGLQYEIITEELSSDIFFDVTQKNNKIILSINTVHIFYDKIFKALHDKRISTIAEFIRIMELIMFSAARSELTFSKRKQGKLVFDFKKEWSSQLKTFIS